MKHLKILNIKIKIVIKKYYTTRYTTLLLCKHPHMFPLRNEIVVDFGVLKQYTALLLLLTGILYVHNILIYMCITLSCKQVFHSKHTFLFLLFGVVFDYTSDNRIKYCCPFRNNTQWNDKIFSLFCFSSAISKHWEAELATLKGNNAKLTAALLESTANVKQWKQQLAAYQEEAERLHKRVRTGLCQQRE